MCVGGSLLSVKQEQLNLSQQVRRAGTGNRNQEPELGSSRHSVQRVEPGAQHLLQAPKEGSPGLGRENTEEPQKGRQEAGRKTQGREVYGPGGKPR